MKTLEITKDWFEKRAADEGDLDIGAGFSAVNPNSEDIAKMERLLFKSLPEWAQNEINELRSALFQQRAWIRHWTIDKEHGLLPTDESLSAAQEAITSIINKRARSS